MVASIIVGTITVIFFLIYLLYSLMKKAVVAGTMEALETYDKRHDDSYEKDMIEIGAEVQKARKKQLEIEKAQAQRALKEAKKASKTQRKA